MIDTPLTAGVGTGRAAHQGQVDKAGVPYLRHPAAWRRDAR